MKKFSIVVLAVLAMSCLFFSCANDSGDSGDDYQEVLGNKNPIAGHAWTADYDDDDLGPITFYFYAWLDGAVDWSIKSSNYSKGEDGYFFQDGVGTYDSSKITFIEEDGNLVATYKYIGINVVLTLENGKNITFKEYGV